MNGSFNTPILFLVFNRPDTTFEVIKEIKNVKPRRLYIAADGPRLENESDLKRCAEVRELIKQGIDWDCEVKTLYREKNLGCGRAVSEAITWFFNNEPEGIILEDDVLPSESFFQFIEELLLMYRNHENVMMISGSNLLNDWNTHQNESYLFSEYAGIWGWGSWRRAWNGYDLEMNSWQKKESKQYFKDHFSSGQAAFFNMIFDWVGPSNQSKIKQIDTWDYQWWYQRLVNKGVGIIPKLNLTRNIGFTQDATHTSSMHDEIKNAQIYEMEFPLHHPKLIEVDQDYDIKVAKKYFRKDRFYLRRIFQTLKTLFE